MEQPEVTEVQGRENMVAREEESFYFILNTQLSALPYEGLYSYGEEEVEILLVFELHVF